MPRNITGRREKEKDRRRTEKKRVRMMEVKDDRGKEPTEEKKGRRLNCTDKIK